MIRDVEHERRRVSLTQVLRESKRALHGVKLNQPDWSPHSHSFAISGELKNEGIVAHIIFNAYWEPLDFELPALEDGSQIGGGGSILHSMPPHEICEWKAENTILTTKYRVGGDLWSCSSRARA